MKILLVDDVTGIRRSVSHVLRSAGYEVDEAVNGEVALEKLREDQYDLVLTDILMPQKDGSEVIQWMRKQSHCPRIVAMSGGGGQSTAEQALAVARAQSDAVLLKPFARQQLLETVQRALAAA